MEMGSAVAAVARARAAAALFGREDGERKRALEPNESTPRSSTCLLCKPPSEAWERLWR